MFHNDKHWSWNCSTQTPAACVLIMLFKFFLHPTSSCNKPIWALYLTRNSCHWLDTAYFHNLCLYCGKKRLCKWSRFQSHSVEVLVINWGRKQKQSLGLSNCWGLHFLNFILAFESTMLLRQFTLAHDWVYMSSWDLGLGKCLQGWPE